MTDEPKPEPDPDGDAAFAELLRKIGDLIAAREAANPTPPPQREPRVDKPGALIAAEKDVLCCQLIEKLELLHCGGPEKCQRTRCRRSRRCAEIEDFKPLAEEARAALAREQAKWKPPQAPPEARPPRRRRG
jgi:hypothetical protein